MQYEMARLAIDSDRSERAAFIRRTYLHLAGAILAFVLLEVAFFKLIVPGLELESMLETYMRSRGLQLVMLFAFIGVGYLARFWAYSGSSQQLQYAGLALYVLFEAIIFVPILYIASIFGGQEIFAQAGILTLSLFGGLTATVFLTRKDFSFLAPILFIASFIMLGVVLCAFFFGGFTLGLGFSVIGVILAAGFILYDTSNVMLHFRTDQHVAAALDLFASVAYLFFHILRILLLTRR
ncbi:MAG TPA: Bax inhibitor-1 family protein [Gemmataceae bacterium]|nr:Bax inhibitor-1 family protein [Gemmataceae bacterium]